MNSRFQLYFGLVAVALQLGCARSPSAHSQLEQFWQNRPTNGNPSELAGYDRSFAKGASPALIDAMIADLQGRTAAHRFETYALVAYYMPRPATTSHFADLRSSSSENAKRWVERFSQRFDELDAEAARHRLETQK